MLLRADFERGYLSDSESLGSSKSSGNSLPRASKSMAFGGWFGSQPIFSHLLHRWWPFPSLATQAHHPASWHPETASVIAQKNYTITITIIVWISVFLEKTFRSSFNIFIWEGSINPLPGLHPPQAPRDLPRPEVTSPPRLPARRLCQLSWLCQPQGVQPCRISGETIGNLRHWTTTISQFMIGVKHLLSKRLNQEFFCITSQSRELAKSANNASFEGGWSESLRDRPRGPGTMSLVLGCFDTKYSIPWKFWN